MSRGRPPIFACALVAVGLVAAAYLSRSVPLASGALVLAAACLVGWGWMRARKAASEMPGDPAMSTLVFPPESKFQQSVLPRQ